MKQRRLNLCALLLFYSALNIEVLVLISCRILRVIPDRDPAQTGYGTTLV